MANLAAAIGNAIRRQNANEVLKRAIHICIEELGYIPAIIFREAEIEPIPEDCVVIIAHPDMKYSITFNGCTVNVSDGDR
jgi:hypothetical protein